MRLRFVFGSVTLMSLSHAGLAEVVRRDPRYAYEAYEFLFQALHHTQKRLGRQAQKEGGEGAPERHVSGRELVEGARSLALEEFGLMARVVFNSWGIRRTDDFGEMVFNLIDAQLMSKTDEDSKADFHNVFDLDDDLLREYQIKMEEF